MVDVVDAVWGARSERPGDRCGDPRDRAAELVESFDAAGREALVDRSLLELIVDG